MPQKICIVDHDPASRVYLRECLEGMGHEPVFFDDGAKVKPLVPSREFHIFIMNLDAPGTRERGLLQEIKRSTQSRVLLIVNCRGDAFLKEAIELGVYGFIYKPYNPEEICALVNHLTR